MMGCLKVRPSIVVYEVNDKPAVRVAKAEEPSSSTPNGVEAAVDVVVDAAAVGVEFDDIVAGNGATGTNDNRLLCETA